MLNKRAVISNNEYKRNHVSQSFLSVNRAIEALLTNRTNERTNKSKRIDASARYIYYLLVVQCVSVYEIEWGSVSFVLSVSDESFSIEINSKQEL